MSEGDYKLNIKTHFKLDFLMKNITSSYFIDIHSDEVTEVDQFVPSHFHCSIGISALAQQE